MKWHKNTVVEIFHRKSMSTETKIHHGRSSDTDYQMMPLMTMIELSAGDEVYVKRGNEISYVHTAHSVFLGYMIDTN